MYFDTTILTFVSVTSPDIAIFTSPMVTVDGVSGVLSANSFAPVTAPTTLREGSSIHIATVTFSMNSNAPPGIRSFSAFNMRCLFLVNVNGNQFVTDTMATVYDYVGINTDGQLSIQVSTTPVLIGGYAYPMSGAFIIIKPSGTSSSISISGIGFR